MFFLLIDGLGVVDILGHRAHEDSNNDANVSKCCLLSVCCRTGVGALPAMFNVIFYFIL